MHHVLFLALVPCPNDGDMNLEGVNSQMSWPILGLRGCLARPASTVHVLQSTLGTVVVADVVVGVVVMKFGA